MLTWLILMGGLTATFAAYVGAQRLTGAPVLAARFRRYAGPIDETPQSSLHDTWSEFLVKPLAPLVMRLLPSTYMEAIRTRLRQSGRPGTLAFHAFVVCQAACALVGGLVGAALGGHYILAGGILGLAAGAMVPALLLEQAVKRRQAAIESVLCDTLDLLTACVEAGLGLDAAVAQLMRRRNTTCLAVNQELGRYLQELRIGTPRADALRNLGQRAGVEDLRHVTTALVHGDSLGVGVSQVLRAQTKHLRMRRKQRAEEKAMKAPIKILFPLLFGIFPSIFVLVLGPAVLRLLDTFIGKF